MPWLGCAPQRRSSPHQALEPAPSYPLPPTASPPAVPAGEGRLHFPGRAAGAAAGRGGAGGRRRQHPPQECEFEMLPQIDILKGCRVLLLVPPLAACPWCHAASRPLACRLAHGCARHARGPRIMRACACAAQPKCGCCAEVTNAGMLPACAGGARVQRGQRAAGVAGVAQRALCGAGGAGLVMLRLSVVVLLGTLQSR